MRSARCGCGATTAMAAMTMATLTAPSHISAPTAQLPSALQENDCLILPAQSELQLLMILSNVECCVLSIGLCGSNGDLVLACRGCQLMSLEKGIPVQQWYRGPQFSSVMSGFITGKGPSTTPPLYYRTPWRRELRYFHAVSPRQQNNQLQEGEIVQYTIFALPLDLTRHGR